MIELRYKILPYSSRRIVVSFEYGKRTVCRSDYACQLRLHAKFLTLLSKSKNQRRHRKPIMFQSAASVTIETPLESLEVGYEKIRGELKNELLDRLN
jgi:hypothetical protein